MKIKPEHIPSEINHRLQVLVIDFELFTKTSPKQHKEKLDNILIQLTQLKDTFVKITKHEDLKPEIVQNGQQVVSNLIEKLPDIKMDTKEGKNEKMALLNQMHYLKNLLLIKN